jgi:hypothetical protein
MKQRDSTAEQPGVYYDRDPQTAPPTPDDPQQPPAPSTGSGKPPVEEVVIPTTSRDGWAGGAPLTPRRAPPGARSAGRPNGQERRKPRASQWYSGNSTEVRRRPRPFFRPRRCENIPKTYTLSLSFRRAHRKSFHKKLFFINIILLRHDRRYE